MAISGVLRGSGSTTKKGLSGSETAMTGVTAFNVQLSRGLKVEHAAGSEDAYEIKEGNKVITGNLSKFFRDDNTISEVLGGTKNIDFVGINKGGSTHIIEDGNGTWAELNVAPGSFPGSEIESTEYDDIESNNATYQSMTAADAGDYAAFLVKFDAVGTEATIDFVQLLIDGYGTGPTNGFDVYVREFTDGPSWVKAGSSTAAAAGGQIKVTISDIPTTDYIDASGDMYFMIRSRAVATGTNNVLYLDYVQLLVKDSGNTFENAFQFVIDNTDGTNTETLTFTGVKWGTWSFGFDNTGESIIESITFTALTVTPSSA